MLESDATDLRLLAWFHYGLGAFTALTAAVGIPLVWAGWLMMHPAQEDASPAPIPPAQAYEPELLGAVLVAAGGGLAALCLVHGAALAYVGRCLSQRRRRTLCLVFAVLNLIDLPLGTILSIFTLLILNRPDVRDAFLKSAAGAQAGRAD